MDPGNPSPLQLPAGQRPPAFKKLRWKLALATAGVVLAGLLLASLLALFELQRDSAAEVEGREWKQLEAIVQQLESDEGAASLYAQLGTRIQGCATEADFRQLLLRSRPRLDPLPGHVSRMLWGSSSCTVHQLGKNRLAWITYRTRKGLRISGKWENGALMALSID